MKPSALPHSAPRLAARAGLPGDAATVLIRPTQLLGFLSGRRSRFSLERDLQVAHAGRPTKLAPKSEFALDADYLCFTVREQFPSKTTQAGLIIGRVTSQQPLLIESHMPEHGAIFSDGIESDYLEFRSGVRAIVTSADRRGLLVI